ncbi:ATP-binding protein [Candidatus Saganbacteria bacterium]|nr:ATP-binding protein [Candidatus Saganbacteria bacterium]
MFKRYLANKLPQASFLLFGPRQVGKSTLLSALKTILTVDLLDPEIGLSYSKDPSLLERQLASLPASGWVFIDEVQRVPKLLDVVQQTLEKKPGLKFALSGSSARKLRHGAANLLGGRALYRTLHPLTSLELGSHFDLSVVLNYGSLPKIWTLLLNKQTDLARDFLRSYVTTYIREEIKAEALVRNLQGFQNFLDIAAANFSGQINFLDISRQCSIAYATVREYYSILEDTLVAFMLPPYLKSARKRMSHAPKFYFFDNGVLRAILGTLKAPPSPLELGRLFEQWIIQEVARRNAYDEQDWKLSFWRTSHGAEVDLIIERGDKILAAVECKHKKTIARADLSGLQAFQEAYPGIPMFIVSPVNLPQKIDQILILPPDQLFDTLNKL